MHHSQQRGGLRPISPLGLAGDTPVSTSKPPSTNFSKPTATTPPTDASPATGTSPSAGSLTTVSDASPPSQYVPAIIPLSASEQAWCRDYSSHVASQEAFSLVYDEDAHQRLTQYQSRLNSQPTITDTTLGKMIDELAEYLNCTVPTPRALSHYFKEMGQWPEALVEQAFTKARTNWTFKKFPLIADFARWVQEDKKARDEINTQVRITLAKLAIPRLKQREEAKREAAAAQRTKEHNARMLAMPKAERDDMIRRYASPERAEELIAHYDALQAAVD